ncbi:MAG: xanthine dehydrogenase family protein subunit M [Chloroflexota bacterium]
MKSFAYQAPTTLGDAVALLAGQNGRARPLAGGTDLLVQMRLNLHDVDLVVDVKKIPELNQLSYDASSGLTIGAAVPCAQIYETADVTTNYPGLIDAAMIIGGKAIQGRATLGGNLCNASPSGDSISALIALGATCNISGPDGKRRVPVEDFCVSPGKSALGQGELLVSVQIPAPKPNAGVHYQRFTPRAEMDIAVAGVGAAVELSDDQSQITQARLALAAVAPTPVLATAAAASLIGKAPTEETFSAAATVAQESINPISDVRGTAAQRRHLIGVLTRRALSKAVARAKGEA